MKKLLVIHNKYQQIGGEDIAVENEIKFLKKNYKVEYLYFENKITNYFFDFFTFITNKNTKSTYILEKKIKEFKPDAIYIHNTWFKASLGIFKVADRHKLDVILKLHNFRYFCTRSIYISDHLKGKEFCEACGFRKKRFVIFNNYFKESLIKSLLILIYGRKYFNILKNSDLKILVLTEFHKKFLLKLDISKSKIFVHPNPINIEINKNEDSQEDYIIYAGRVSEEKGVEELIKSFVSSNINEINLKIVGEGPILNMLKKKYKNNSNIYFEGPISNDKVIKLIYNSLAVVTATKLYEGQPTLLCEASYLGIPSIYPRTGGIHEFFPEKYKLAFDQFDYEDLMNKLKIVEDKQRLKKIGTENREFIFTYLNENKMFDRFNMILDE